MKVPKWYKVQEGDATMINKASQPGQMFYTIIHKKACYILAGHNK
jgi:hypothetical protein